MSSIEKLEILKSILDEEEYNKFMGVVSTKQKIITKIFTTPIDNYSSNLFTTEEDKELLKYIYQNVRYYLRKNLTYKNKLEEGIAILFSKAAILKIKKNGSFDNYFRVGERSYQHELVNPFEEMARLILNATKREYFELSDFDNNALSISAKKLELEQMSIQEVLATAISKEGIKSATKNYCYEDIIGSIEEILENSNINSNNINSATTKDNRGVILNVIDKSIDLYHTKLDYISVLSKVPSSTTVEGLKNKFEDKITYAKRNIGVYEKTKRLIK